MGASTVTSSSFNVSGRHGWRVCSILASGVGVLGRQEVPFVVGGSDGGSTDRWGSLSGDFG